MKKLIPALAMLLVSAVLLGTSTFAWFSMNQKVTVTGMEVKTIVNSNLLIAADEIGSTAKKADQYFGTSLTQVVKGYLEPASTINGTTFYYTLNAKADGSKESGDWTEYNAATAATDAAYSNKFSQDYGVTTATVSAYTGEDGPALAYVDYVFQLKAVSTETSYLNLTKVNIIDENAKDTTKAHRIAIFVEDITSGTATAGVGTKQIILTESEAANHTAGKAVSATNAVDTVSYNTYVDSTNNTLVKITGADTKYFKVVVRLWLEGEDTTCFNDAFKVLTNEWKLELELSLETSASSAVTNIAKYRHADVSGDKWTDGTYVWTDINNIGTTTGRSNLSEADAAVKTAFGYTAP